MCSFPGTYANRGRGTEQASSDVVPRLWRGMIRFYVPLVPILQLLRFTRTRSDPA